MISKTSRACGGGTLRCAPTPFLNYVDQSEPSIRRVLSGSQGVVEGCGLAAVTLALAIFGGVTAIAAEEVVAPPVPSAGIFPAERASAFDYDDLIIPEIFSSHLPFTLPKYAFRLRVNPHLGDFQNKDYLRLSTNVRYGLSENWEIGAGSDLYVSHGYGDLNSFDHYGAANLRVSAKVNLGQPFFAGWFVGAGFEYATPLGHPPAQLTDGLRHYMPYLTFSHRLESHRAMRIFWGLRLDEVVHTSLPGEFGRNAFTESNWGITGGWVIDRQSLHYTFEATLDTTRIFSRREQDIFSLRPGVIWEIPSRRGPEVKGHWIVGVAAKSTTGPGGTSLGASFKLSYRSDIKRREHEATIAPTP